MSNGANSNTTGGTQFRLQFKPAGENARVPQTIIDELEARGFVIVEEETESNIVLSVQEPDDQTKIWRKTDANGVPIGNALYAYDSEQGQWLPLENVGQETLPNKTRFGYQFAAAGTSTVNVVFADIGSDKYHVTLTPTLYNNGGWQVPPATFPDKHGFFITNRSQTGFQFQCYGMPTGGITFHWRVEIYDETQGTL